MAKTLVIAAGRDGFRRLGIAFSTRPTRYPADRFTAEQIALLEADPGLIVSTIDEPEPATKSGKGAAE